MPPVTFAREVTAELMPSLTECDAVTSALSVNVNAGVRVVVPVAVQAVPAEPVHAKLHDLVSALPSGSEAVPASVTGDPSTAA